MIDSLLREFPGVPLFSCVCALASYGFLWVAQCGSNMDLVSGVLRDEDFSENWACRFRGYPFSGPRFLRHALFIRHVRRPMASMETLGRAAHRTSASGPPKGSVLGWVLKEYVLTPKGKPTGDAYFSCAHTVQSLA